MASIEDGRQGMRTHSRMADIIVKGAIALVTAAFFIGAYLQFQVSFWLALIAALSVYITLLMLHALMHRSERVEALVSEVDRLEGELARLQVGKPAARPAPQPAARADMQPPRQAPAPAPRGQQMPPAGVRPEPTFAPAPAPSAPPPMPAPAPAASAPAPAQPEAHAVPTLSPWPDPSAPADSSLHDYWSFRPTKAEAPAKPKETAKARAAMEAPKQAESEDDLEAVQGMIKRLAEEVNVGAQGEGAEAAQETAVRVSVDALHTTAGTMRAAVSKTPAAEASPVLTRGKAAAGKPTPSAPPPIAPVHSQLAAVGAALAVQRVSALIEPIVGLSDQQVHHYELRVVPVDERGSAILAIGAERQLSGTGLLPLLDSARLSRAALAARSLAAEGKPHHVFVATTAESLASDRFLDDLANAYRQSEALAGQLVLTFSQADMAAFGGAEWSALTDMRDLGFQFGLADVTDLDYEFTALRAAGFAFVKINAARLADGLAAAGNMMPGGEVCSYLSELGLTVIVDRIDSEPARAKVMECGVRLGEGPLFGPPIAVPAEPNAGFGTAAA